MTQAAPHKSDLGVRVLSAVVMFAVAGTALWQGGWIWTLFVATIALGVLWEWTSLAFAISKNVLARLAWSTAGLLYIAITVWVLVCLRAPYDGIFQVGQLLMTVIGIDVGAYAAGRMIGGPKIAPTISPSKTWAGLFGGAIGGVLIFTAISWAWPSGLCAAYVDYYREPLPYGVFAFDDRCHLAVPSIAEDLLVGAPIFVLVATIAQSGDFFESWMKRRAGVKDSGNLIPGHGGLLDRVDGLLALCLVFGLLWILR